jgi:hypothetical protein
MTRLTLLAAAAAFVSLSASPALAGNAQCDPDWDNCVCVADPIGDGYIHCYNQEILSPEEDEENRGAGIVNIRPNAPVIGTVQRSFTPIR